MAQQKNQKREKFLCSICWNLLREPATLSCGHSYCMGCLQNHFDSQAEERGAFTCPECRETLIPRPRLQKNILLAEVMEELEDEPRAAPADHCYAGDEDVGCDVCTGRKVKAVKSCLDCRASYCEEHLQPHHHAAPLKKHKLVEPCEKLQENICPLHDEVRKIFCRTDQQCICYLCSLDEHKGHDMVSAAAERAEKQKEMETMQGQLHQRVQDEEEDLQLLQQEVKTIDGSADEAVKQSKEVFTQVIQELQRRSSEVEQQIRSQQETEVRRVKDLQETMEQRIIELKKKEGELQELAQTQDHTHFLHSFIKLSIPRGTNRKSWMTHRPLRYFEDLNVTWTDISQVQVDVLLPKPEPETRAEFLNYSHEIKVDPNTVNRRLVLSDENRKVTRMDEDESYPDHPDRFIHHAQVLSRDCLRGRSYWEVEWTGETVDVAVSYKNISRARRSDDCAFGFNDKSWSLVCSENSFTFNHNKTFAVLGPGSSRVGVYLEHGAGTLSFYRVCGGNMTLMHRVQTTFTQPLYAGLTIGPNSSAEFCLPIPESVS